MFLYKQNLTKQYYFVANLYFMLSRITRKRDAAVLYCHVTSFRGSPVSMDPKLTCILNTKE